MKIGIFSSILGRTGGPAVYDQKLIEVLSRIDTENDYVVYGATKQALTGLALANRRFTGRTVIPSGKWLSIAIGLSAELVRHPIDFLHATFVAPPLVPCKLISTMTCWSQYDSPTFYPPLIRWRLQYLLNNAMRKSTAIICYTDYLKQKVIEKFEIPDERVFVVPAGVGDEMKPLADKHPVEEFLKRVGIDGPYILFIGQITERKNVEGLVRAYEILKRSRNIDHKLVIVGETGFLSDRIFRTVADLKLGSDVVFPGRFSYRELPLFYNGADVFVFPTFSEGFGLPPLEAMACRCPVVASNVTSVPEVVGDAALLVDPHSPDEIADSIYRAIFNPEVRTNLIRRGEQRARRFTWSETGARTAECYQRVHAAGW